MLRLFVIASALTGLLQTSLPAVAEPLRITHLQRCGNLLDTEKLHYCLAMNHEGNTPQVLLDGKPLPTGAVARTDYGLRLSLDADQPSGPLWLERDDQPSNPVWLSTGRSHVIAAAENEVATNQEGLTTWVNLRARCEEARRPRYHRHRHPRRPP